MASPESDAPGPEKRLTPSAIAKDWGCSRAYASVCISKKGCPTDSLEAAREWRIKNSKYGVGYRSKGAPTSAVPPSPDKKPKPGAPSPRSRLESRDLSAIEESLKAAIEVEQEAHRLVLEAQQDRSDSILSIRIAAYNKALTNRQQAQEAVQKYLIVERINVPMAEAKAVARKGYDAMIPLMRALPNNAGPLCNPDDPLRAANILKQQVEAIIAQGAREYAA